MKTDNLAAAETETEQMWTRYHTRPEFVEVMEDLKRQYWFAGQRATSQTVCRRLLAAFPDHPRAVYLQRDLIFGYLAMNDRAVAKTETEQMLARYQEHPDFVRCAHDVGWEFESRGDYDTALQIYQDLKSKFPGHERAAWFQRSIMQCYMRKGDTENLAAAVEELKNNYKSNTDYVKQMEIAADRLTEKEQHAFAKDINESLLEQFPGHEDEIWFLKNKIRAELGLNDESAADADVVILHQKYATHEEYHDALSWTAYEYRTYGYYDKAIAMYQELYAKNPNDKVKLRCDEGIARCNVRLGNDAKVDEKIEKIYTDYYADNPDGVAFYIHGIGEEYYKLARAKRNSIEARTAYNKAIDILETAVPTVHNNRYRCMVHYTTALCYWHLQDWFSTANALLEAVNANPDFEYAGSMHWMVSYCYEKLKESGNVTAEKADQIIEWGYQTLFDNYPDSRDVEYAALKLGKIHLARGEPVSACEYFNWFLDHTHADDGRIADIGRIMEKMEQYNYGIITKTGVFMAAIALFYATAWPCVCPPCPPCYHQTGSYPNCNCAWDCGPCEGCAYGHCTYNCSSANCEICDNGSCVSSCESNNCEICDNGSCVSRCNPANCNESCIAGVCVICNGDPDKVCCDGTCTDQCSLGDEDDSCSSPILGGPTCTSDCQGGSQGECQVDVYRVYNGGGTNSCSGGCPGECSDVGKLCYTDYPCISVSSPLGLCESNSNCILWVANQCYFCTADMEHGTPTPASYWECSSP